MEFTVKKHMDSRLDVEANNQPPIQFKMVSKLWNHVAYPSPSCPQG